MEFNATFIVAFISFIVFTVIMNLILYKPINDIVNKRQNFIDGNYSEAEYNSAKANDILKDKEDQINNAKNEAKDKITLQSNIAKGKKEETLVKAKNKSKDEIINLKKELIATKNDVCDGLKTDIIGLAQLISDKFLETHEKIEDVDYELIDKIMQG